MPLGIPFVITADPVHSIGMSHQRHDGRAVYAQQRRPTAQVSHWPQPFGLGAINDTNVTFQYGDTIRQRVHGDRLPLAARPMADVATEPRWARVQNTFGENALHVAST